MSDKKVKLIMSGITVAVTVLKIVVQHRNQIMREGGKVFEKSYRH